MDKSAEIAELVKLFGIVVNAKGECWTGGHMFYRGERLMYKTASGPKP